MMVPEGGFNTEAAMLPSSTSLEGLHLFGLQVGVGMVALQFVIHLRERGYAERGVVRGMQFPVLIRTIADVDAWIDGHIHVAPGVLHGHQTCGEGEVPEQQVVLEITADVCTVYAQGVITIRTFDMMRL